MKLQVIISDDGNEYLDLLSTIRACGEYAENHGFERSGTSNVSEAIYFDGPDGVGRLRVAAHAGDRDGVLASAIFPQKRVLVEGSWERVVPLRPRDAMTIIKVAIADYSTQAASC